jgi:hypothetical protein
MPTLIKIKTSPTTQLNLTLGFKIWKLPNSMVSNSHTECSVNALNLIKNPHYYDLKYQSLI